MLKYNFKNTIAIEQYHFIISIKGEYYFGQPQFWENSIPMNIVDQN